MIKIILSRHGAKKRPFFHIVATDSRFPRDGRYIEKIGTYQPILPKDDEKRVALNIERVKYWLSVGAQPTDRVALFLSNAGLIAKPVITEKPKQSAPKKKAVARAAEKAQKLAEAKEAEIKAKEEAEAQAKAENEAKLSTESEVVNETANTNEVLNS